MPPRKLTTELSYYKFSKKDQRRPNWLTIADRLGIRPTAPQFLNVNQGTYRRSYLWRNFVREVQTRLENRYRYDTELVIQPFSFNYRYKYKKEPRIYKGINEGQVRGTRTQIPELVRQAYDKAVDELDDSPFELVGADDVIEGELIVAPVNGGKLVAKGIRVARMKKAGALKLDLDYIGDNSWDRNEDTCVFDYIYHKYKGKPRIKKFLPDDNQEIAYSNLNSIFSSQETDALSQGVCVDDIKIFCERFDIAMIAMDKNEKTIEYVRSQNQHLPALIYIVSNNHFYPVEDKHKRLSVSASAREDDKPDEEKFKIKSEDYVIEKKEEKEKKEYKLVYPKEGDPKGNEFAIKVINELGTLPMPKSLRVEGQTIISFTIGDTKYITTPYNEEVEKYCKIKKIPFTGQSTNSILMNFWIKQNGDDKFISKEIQSIMNPMVFQSLTTEGVKYRTHYGATRYLGDLFDVLPPVSFTLKTFNYENQHMIVNDLKIKIPSNCKIIGCKCQEVKRRNTKLLKGFKQTNELKPYKNIFTGELIYEKKDIVKTRKFVFKPKLKIQQLVEDGTAVCIDIRKCYSACIINPFDNFIKYGLEDTWEKYQDEPLETGLYYVETDDLTLLHQTNIYSNKILEKAIELGIPLKIKRKLIHKKLYADETIIGKDYFHPLIKDIKKETQGTDLGKLLINMITGYLGKTERTNYTAEIDTDMEAVWRHYLDCERPEQDADFKRFFFSQEFDETGYNRFHKNNLVLKTLNGLNDEKAYLYGYETRTQLMECSLPMYIQILDWSNMRLFDMGKEVGGEIIYRHTDFLVSLGGKLPIRRMTPDWGDYQEEPKNCNWKKIMNKERKVVIPQFYKKWEKNPDLKDSDDWKQIIEYAIEKGGLMIEGRAGTGKSFVPKSAFNEGIIKLNENARSMSFTNKASRNIMGTTIHKLLHITGSGNIPKKTMNSLKKYKYFIIDEIGMISNQLWKYLMLLKKENPKAVFILMGDWRQLPPIEEGRVEATNVFNHPVVKFLCNGNKVELTTRKRYDKDLWDFLEIGIENNVWEGLNEKSVSFEEIYSSKNICYFNKTRVSINKLCMDYFANQTESYFLNFEITDEKDKQQPVWLYEGLPVMSWKNNVDMNIVNSEEFVITFVDENKLVLKRDCEGEDIEIETEKFHDFFLANYCSTTHKSQGATYAGNVILWDWDRIIRDKKVAYTACSRATAKDKLIVSQGIK